MSATETRLTCTDCGRELHESIDRIFQVCGPCMARWRVLSAIVAPSRAGFVVTQDDRDAAHDALVEMPRCEHCYALLTDDNMRDVHGHANGCDVDETVFACLCGATGVL
jgi:hypothetical protein